MRRPVDDIATDAGTIEGADHSPTTTNDTSIAAHPTIVHGDPARLSQIIANLVGNAVTFAPTGGRITVTVHPPTPNVAMLTVADDRPGIEPTNRDHIFERFY